MTNIESDTEAMKHLKENWPLHIIATVCYIVFAWMMNYEFGLTNNDELILVMILSMLIGTLFGAQLIWLVEDDVL